MRLSDGHHTPASSDVRALPNVPESLRPEPANDVDGEDHERSSIGFTAPKRRPTPAKLSHALWPNWIPDGVLRLNPRITAHPATADDTSKFLASHFDQLFPSETPWYREDSRNKVTFMEAVADMFLLRDGEDTIGVFMGNPVDWATYYVRLVALLPSHQNQSVGLLFTRLIVNRLRDAGVERVEAETAPSNGASIKALLGLGFQASGTVLSERWGTLCRWTLHLSRSSELAFVDQFCFGGRLHRDAFHDRSKQKDRVLE